MSNFEEIKKIEIEKQKHLLNNLEEYKEELKKISADNNQRLIDFYVRRINRQFDLINKIDYKLKYMRDNNKEDLDNRNKIIKEYSKLIKKIIPDNIPIVFYGINNIGIVKEIIKNGLLIKENDNKSLETQIEVTYKNNVRSSLELADPGSYSYMPYGVIFAFKPLESELDNVYKTSDSVLINSFNIKDEPNRLYSIITTKENIPKVKKWCLEYGIDSDKVNTHDEFLKKCKNFGMFNKNNNFRK